MRSLILIGAGITAAISPSYLNAEPTRVSAGGVTVQVDPTLPVLSCAVIHTSGDAAVDDQTCLRVLADTRAQIGETAPLTISFQPDERGRFISCRPPQRVEPSPEFQSRCASELERIRRMRAMVAINMPNWIESRDLSSLPTPAGSALVRLGVDDGGKVSYCLLVEPKEAPLLEQSLCAIIGKRARFRPALDIKGRPMPSTFNYPINWKLQS